jgi:hypothetical protein
MKIRTLATILFVAAATTVFGAADDDLFSAVRAGDSGRIKALLQGGADVNVRDDLGANSADVRRGVTGSGRGPRSARCRRRSERRNRLGSDSSHVGHWAGRERSSAD